MQSTAHLLGHHSDFGYQGCCDGGYGGPAFHAHCMLGKVYPGAYPIVILALIERLNDTAYSDWDDEENIAEIAAMSLTRIGTSDAVAAVEKWRREKR